MADRCPPDKRQRRGAILIVAMIIIFAIAALVLTLGQAMRVEAAVAANAAAAREASLAARGAEQYVIALLAEQTEDQPVELLDQGNFEALPIGSAYVWLLRPDYNDAALPLYGLVDESSKININAVGYERMRLVAGMTDDLAASIVDWRDEDEDPTEGIGAETPAYLGGSEGYAAKNEPFETVDETLLVRGMTPELLHGEGEAALNDAGLGGTTSFGSSFVSEQYRITGLQEYLTVWGGAATTSADGTERLDLNNAQGRQAVRDVLTEVFGEARGGELGNLMPQGNVVDLFDWARRLSMTGEELAEVEDRLTVNTAVAAAPGLINANWAPRELLLTIPELTEADVDTLLSQREGAVQDRPHSIAWILEALEDKAIGMGLRLTGRGSHYSAELLAVAGNGRAYRRVRIVVDTSGVEPVIVYRRDITDRGWPLDPEILTSLREGNGLISGTLGRP